MDNAIDRLKLIVMLIDLAQADLSDSRPDIYAEDRRLVEATFRVLHIGENTIHPDPSIRARHAGLPWRAMATTRNVLAHDYSGINHDLIRRIVTEFLGDLKRACVAELTADKIQGD